MESPPAKLSNDDITHDFMTGKKLCLKEAINYLETGTVSAKGSHQNSNVIPSFQKNLHG